MGKNYFVEADGHEISFEGRILRYMTTYWYAGEFSAIKMVYSKDKEGGLLKSRKRLPSRF